MKIGKYKHWKGNYYELLFVGFYEKDMSEVAIYKNEKGHIFVRDIKEFLERFQFISPSEQIILFDWKNRRKKSNLTLKEVEKMTGISNAYLSQLETGKIKNPSFNTVVALDDFYKSYGN